LKEKIKEGTKFFINHGKGTNDHEGRDSVGEIVSSYTDIIDGKLSNVVIGHFPDKAKVKDMDVCSIEAELDTYEDNVVSDVDKISGVALGNSQRDHPAFPGALRLGAVQCFNNSGEEEKEEMAKEKITFNEVKEAVREMNIRPRQLYTMDEIKDDREYGKQFETISTLTSENERLLKENEDIKTANQDTVKKSEIATANTRLDERLKEGFTDLQKSFIKNQFNPEKMEAVTDEALDTFVEDSKKDFAATAKLFSVPEDKLKNDTKTKEETEDGNSDGASDDELKTALEEMGVK